MRVTVMTAYFCSPLETYHILLSSIMLYSSSQWHLNNMVSGGRISCDINCKLSICHVVSFRDKHKNVVKICRILPVFSQWCDMLWYGVGEVWCEWKIDSLNLIALSSVWYLRRWPQNLHLTPFLWSPFVFGLQNNDLT